MHHFIVSARKYRPTTFSEVVGQDSISTTLINEISGEHLAQSFLFCGPKGVGKTSSARILAKTINCLRITDNIEPCDHCESCCSFNESHSFNIHELDAASNNSVDDIRNLVDQVRFAPQIGKYDIYIIDEVHMLSQAAFNAFLKTLEEPPKHAIFILATTEKHKIIPTILSRCQIFDFKRIGVQDIVKHLTYVSEKENIKSEQDALHIIAQKADGSLRDALSIFDRLASFSNQITSQNVIKNLNILDYDYYFKITHSILEKDISSSLLLFNKILDNGFDAHHFINGLASHLRDLLVTMDEETLVLLEKGKPLKEMYLQQSKLTNQSFLLNALDLCNTCDIDYKTSKNQNLLVELCLMKLCTIKQQEMKKKITDKISLANSPIIKDLTIKSDIKELKKKIINPNDIKPEEFEKENEDHEENNTPQLISISEILNDPIEDIKENKKEVVEDFDNEKLLIAWKQYIKLQKEEGKSNFATTLDMNEPILHDNYKIEVLLSNKAQEVMLEKEKMGLLDFLRNKLKNDMIEITTKTNEILKENIPYTNKEKYQQMIEVNPNLEHLKEQLGLDYDF